jgi:imidazolonepropionase-like amidohydrolase
VIAPGARADLVVWDAEHPAQIRLLGRRDPVAAVVKRGRFVEGT